MSMRKLTGARQATVLPYVTSEMSSIIQSAIRETGDKEIGGSLRFSPTSLTMVRHVMMTHGTIITDTTLAMAELDRSMVDKLHLNVKCFIDDPQIMDLAEQRRCTRAEIALDYAMGLDGLKLIAVGSAPTALNRLLQRCALIVPNDLVVLAAPTGFASVVQLKERMCESAIPSIVVRGKRGGAAVTCALLNALMAESIRQQNL